MIRPRNLKTFILMSVIAIAFVGCEKIKEAAEFDILYEVPQTEIEVDSTVVEVADNQMVILQKEIFISLDSIRRKHNLESFENAKFEYIRLEAFEPSNADLNWISHLSATVTAQGIAESEVATYTASGNAGKTIDMQLLESPITPFLMNERFTLKVYARFDPPLPASEVKIKLNSRIRITVQPL